MFAFRFFPLRPFVSHAGTEWQEHSQTPGGTRTSRKKKENKTGEDSAETIAKKKAFIDLTKD